MCFLRFISFLLRLCRDRKNACVLELGHIAIDQVQVAAFLLRNTVEVFKLPNIVSGHPAILTSDRITVHAALVVASEKPVHIELKEVFLLFIQREQGSLHGLFPAAYPRVERVFYEFQRLLLDI